jgi:hypothetical protein
VLIKNSHKSLNQFPQELACNKTGNRGFSKMAFSEKQRA